jgi:hypothetical protein
MRPSPTTQPRSELTTENGKQGITAPEPRRALPAGKILALKIKCWLTKH